MSLLEKVSLLLLCCLLCFHAIIQSFVCKYSQCIRSLQSNRNKKNLFLPFLKKLNFLPQTPPPLRFCLELTLV